MYIEHRVIRTIVNVTKIQISDLLNTLKMSGYILLHIGDSLNLNFCGTLI